MARRGKTRRVREIPVSMDVDETASHYLIYISPSLDGAALGLSPYRARLPKCLCGATPVAQTAKCCRWCAGWSLYGLAGFVRKLLRSYPRVTRVVPVEDVTTTQRLRFAAAVAATAGKAA